MMRPAVTSDLVQQVQPPLLAPRAKALTRDDFVRSFHGAKLLAVALEGRNIAVAYRYADGRAERFAEIAVAFVSSKVDVIVTWGKLSHIALSWASPTEPIEGRTPAASQRSPKARDVYCAGSTSRRNTAMLN